MYCSKYTRKNNSTTEQVDRKISISYINQNIYYNGLHRIRVHISSTVKRHVMKDLSIPVSAISYNVSSKNKEKRLSTNVKLTSFANRKAFFSYSIVSICRAFSISSSGTSK